MTSLLVANLLSLSSFGGRNPTLAGSFVLNLGASDTVATSEYSLIDHALGTGCGIFILNLLFAGCWAPM